MRVAFMGTPVFATPTLERLVANDFEVVSVVTQPDRPAGRGRRVAASPVKEKAIELGLSVYQPERIKLDEAYEHLAALAPEAIVVVGYGQIIPRRIIDLPPRGCVNVHSSLLPKYRGAAPIQWAIVNGENLTGVCTMLIVEKLDAGDVLLCRETRIGREETASELTARLAPLGASLLIETLRGLDAGTIKPVPQNDAEATYAPIIKRSDGLIDWGLSAREIFNRVRGFDPWPGAYTFRDGRRLLIREARAFDHAGDPGVMTVQDDRLLIGCGSGCLEALAVQPEGRGRMSAAEYVRGYRPRSGERLG